MGTYSKINTTKLGSLLSFERKSIDGHQTNDEKEGIDEHPRGVVVCKERVVRSGGISRSTTIKSEEVGEDGSDQLSMIPLYLHPMTPLTVAGLRSISIKLVLVHTPVPLFLCSSYLPLFQPKCLHLSQCIEQPGSYY
jgi:hypothetical protein